MSTSHTQVVREIGGRAVKFEGRWGVQLGSDDLDVVPTEAIGETAPKCFQRSFLGGEPSGDVRGESAPFARRGEFPFAFRQQTHEECVGVSLQGSSNAFDLDDVDSKPHDHGQLLIRSRFDVDTCGLGDPAQGSESPGSLLELRARIDECDLDRYHHSAFILPRIDARLGTHPVQDLLKDLNEAQCEAVCYRGGPLLVVAGAGSGKTRVITRRIAYVIRSGLRSSEVLAITFTNKAAAEMRQRVEQLIGRNHAWVSTFHSLGARILRMEAVAAGLDPNFTIFDASDQLAIVREILKEIGFSGRDSSARDYLSIISNCKNAGFSPQDSENALVAEHLRVFEAYERALAANKAVDFDDLLLRTVRLLESDETVRQRFAGRFESLLIDEYQDTNRLQYRMTRLLSPASRDVCATGDPDQSIYSWRGADVRNILEFDRDFEGAKVIKLEENYRSTNRILKAASTVIRNNQGRIERELWSKLGDGEPLRLRIAMTEREEARNLAEDIKSIRRQGVTLDQIAVLYRTNSCSRLVEQAMRDANLPYVIVGAVEFYERREIKDLIAYLRLIANPSDELDFTRVLNVPARGIGAKTLEQMRSIADALQIPLVDVVSDSRFLSELKGQKTKTALLRFADLIRELRAMPRSPVLHIIDRIIDETEYRAYLRDAADPQADDRLENVEELRRAVREYDLEHPMGSLEEFLNDTALVRSRDPEESGEPCVTLMTLHSAKGLEFPHVYIVALEEGMLPHARSLDDPDGIEEERRLFYVGITRAQRRLTLSLARNRAGPSSGFTAPSRFLYELPQDCVDGALRPKSMLSFREDVTDFESSYEPDYDSGETPFETGDIVTHERFGVGRVVEMRGFGPSAQVIVDFEQSGRRKLMLEFARLRKAVR